MSRWRAFAVGLVLATAYWAPINATSAEPNAEVCLTLDSVRGSMTNLEWKRLRIDCIVSGYTVKLRTSDVEVVPLDVAGALVLIDPLQADEILKLEAFPGIRVHPVVRDLYCRTFAQDWVTLASECPLPSMFPLQDVNAYSMAFMGPKSLLEWGIPYDLELGGRAGSIRNLFGDGLLYTKSLVIRSFSADYVALEGLMVQGDLTVENSTITALGMERLIVTGDLILKGISPERIEIDNVLVHGSLIADDLSIGDGLQCAAGRALEELNAPLEGPRFLSRCIDD